MERILKTLARGALQMYRPGVLQGPFAGTPWSAQAGIRTLSVADVKTVTI